MPIDLVIDEREGAGSTTSKSPENLNDPTDLGSDQVRLAAILDAILCGVFTVLFVCFVYVCFLACAHSHLQLGDRAHSHLQLGDRAHSHLPLGDKQKLWRVCASV